MADLERRYGRGRFCPTGSAVVSDAGDLPGDVGDPRRRADLAGAVRRASPSCSQAPTERRCGSLPNSGATSVAFPSISTGVYGYPVDLAAQIAIDTVSDVLAMEPGSVERVTFVLFSRDALAVFEEVLSR